MQGEQMEESPSCACQQTLRQNMGELPEMCWLWFLFELDFFSGLLFWCLRGHQCSVDYRVGKIASEPGTENPLNIYLGQ